MKTNTSIHVKDTTEVEAGRSVRDDDDGPYFWLELQGHCGAVTMFMSADQWRRVRSTGDEALEADAEAVRLDEEAAALTG